MLSKHLPLLIRQPGEYVLRVAVAGSHHIVSIDHCPISSDGIVSRLDAIRRIAAAIATSSEPFRVTVLETLSGLDLAFEGVKKVGDKERRARWSD